MSERDLSALMRTCFPRPANATANATATATATGGSGSSSSDNNSSSMMASPRVVALVCDKYGQGHTRLLQVQDFLSYLAEVAV